MIDGTDDFRILIHTSFDIFSHRLSGHSHTVRIQQTFFIQFIHHCIDAAGLVQLLDISRACRCQMAQIRGLRTDLVGKAYIKIHSDLMGNRRQMQHTVGGTSKSHIHGQSIQNCFLCHDITGSDVSPVHLHHLHAGMFCQADTLGVDCRNRAVSF